METLTAKQVVTRFLDAVSAGDQATFVESFEPDARWWVGGDIKGVTGTFEGREQILDVFLSNALRLFEPGTMEFTVTSLVAEGDLVSAEWNLKATTALGTVYDNLYNVMFEVRDGRIAAVREYTDTLYAKEVLGPVAG
jgi:uncharacterized protein